MIFIPVESPLHVEELGDSSTGTQVPGTLNGGSPEDEQSDVDCMVPENEAPNFTTLVSSPLFVWDLVWLTCHRFASWSFVGRLNPALTQLADNDATLGKNSEIVSVSLTVIHIYNWMCWR